MLTQYCRPKWLRNTTIFTCYWERSSRTLLRFKFAIFYRRLPIKLSRNLSTSMKWKIYKQATSCNLWPWSLTNFFRTSKASSKRCNSAQVIWTLSSWWPNTAGRKYFWATFRKRDYLIFWSSVLIMWCWKYARWDWKSLKCSSMTQMIFRKPFKS